MKFSVVGFCRGVVRSLVGRTRDAVLLPSSDLLRLDDWIDVDDVASPIILTFSPKRSVSNPARAP
jgi:hypothetical protein